MRLTCEFAVVAHLTRNPAIIRNLHTLLPPRGNIDPLHITLISGKEVKSLGGKKVFKTLIGRLESGEISLPVPQPALELDPQPRLAQVCVCVCVCV